MNVLNTSGYEMYNPSVIKANNCTLTDVNGKLYYDFEAGVWALPLGHNHPRINKVIINRLSKISHVGYRYNDPVTEKAAEALLRIMNLEKGKCLFLSSGSEAVEFAVKVVQRLTDKPFLMKLDQHYLSAYGLSGDTKTDRWINVNWQSYVEEAIANCSRSKPSVEEERIKGNNIVVDSINTNDLDTTDIFTQDIAITKERVNTDQLSKVNGSGATPEDREIDYSKLLEQIPFDQIGAFVFEPGNASGTAKLPPKKLIEALVANIKRHDGYVVVDEVTTGMGRTGKWFAYEHYKLKPDIIACGKGLGNGYPVSAVGIRKEIVELLEKTDFGYGQSHQNDPMGCAIAKEVIATIREEGLLKKATELGEYFRNELYKLKASHNCIKEIRGVGLMITIEMEEQMNTMIGKSTMLSYLHKQLYASGFLVGIKPTANLLRFYPPLTIEKYMIDDLIFNLEHILPYNAQIG